MLPKVIDLFSGCGGMALGFTKAGFEIAGGIELMPQACQTISVNLDSGECKHICGDITLTDGSIFKDKIGKEGCIVIGGPPCQAYSMAGRGKLRSLGENRVNTKDSRGYLYQDFLRFAFDLNARAVVMENVPAAVKFGDMNIPEIVCDELEQHGYTSYWTVLNSADFGVPQVRERIFVIAINNTECSSVDLPMPTNRDFSDSKTQYQKRFESFKNHKHFRMPISTEGITRKWNTVDDALSDLPSLFPKSTSKFSPTKLNTDFPYKHEPSNEYQTIMRNWNGRSTNYVSGNAFRKTVRDFPIFEKMNEGDSYVDASKIAMELFQREVCLFGIERDSEHYKTLFDKMVPKYDTTKFENKWMRLRRNKPSHTLVAHLSKDTYSHIHPWEPRGISVREAARIQSFPDDFYFNGTMGDAYKQIGNAVPPLLALGVARSLLKVFTEE